MSKISEEVKNNIDNSIENDMKQHASARYDSKVDVSESKEYGSKEMVRHPDHYSMGDTTYEPYKVIAAWEANFNIGSAIKYLARYKKKWNPIEDLEKAKQYIDFEIEHLKKMA